MKVRKLIDENDGVNYWLWCPACDEAVRINDAWRFDGDMNRPTFEPSILTEGPRGKCHAYLRSGVWEFLQDSSHALAGLSAPVIDLPDWLAHGESGG